MIPFDSGDDNLITFSCDDIFLTKVYTAVCKAMGEENINKLVRAKKQTNKQTNWLEPKKMLRGE